ncbi:MAG: c-type cytochrome [Proteobacteria bacterium]|nr:c-type cytochrome [Pseudomonadota bacterium]
MKSCRLLIITLGLLLSGLGIAAESERQAYDDRYCTTCHGTDGKGNEGVQAPRLAGMEQWYLERQLNNFRAGLRGVHPQDIEGIAMRDMATQLSDDSIADIIAWVASWKYVAAEETIEGNANAGRQLYATCATCHGNDGEGNAALGAPALAGQNDWYLVTQLKNFKAGYRGNLPEDGYGQQMRLMAQTLVDEQRILNVVSYINTLTGDR